MQNSRTRRVLVVNKFLHHVGGVETYVAWLARELSAVGYKTAFFGMSPPPENHLMQELDGPIYLSPNRDYYGSSASVPRSAAAAVYSPVVEKRFQAAVADFRPDLIHIHSTCYQLTPSIVRAVNRQRLPSVTTAHEYKFVCSNQRLWDDSAAKPCYDCLSKGVSERMRTVVANNCVKGRRSSSAVAALELPVSQSIWRRYKGLVHAPSLYMKSMLETSGSPVANRLRYLDLPWGQLEQVEPVEPPEGAPVVTYIGRLSREKGVETLLQAWPKISEVFPRAELRIHGGGGDVERLSRAAKGLRGVIFGGSYSGSELGTILSASSVTVHPSLWAENSPFTVRESLRHGVPAVVSSVGGLPEMISGATGGMFPPGDPQACADAVLRELRLQRAHTSQLRAAVAARLVSDTSHLQGLEALYAEANESLSR